MGELDSAEDLDSRVHATHLRSCGSRHPETIAALIALSHVRRSEVSLAKEVVAGYAETFGAEHPFHRARTALWNERKVLLEETFQLYADALGVVHPDAGRAARNERVDVEFDPPPL